MIRAELYNVSDANNLLQNYCYKQMYDVVTGDLFDLVEFYEMPLSEQ